MIPIDVLRGVIINLFVLLGFVAVCTMGHGWAERTQRQVAPWIVGLLFGMMAVIAMMIPVIPAPGMIFDSRSGVMGAAAILGGPIVALASLPIPLVYRFHVGGSGLVPGMLELLFPSILGSLCHILKKRYHRNLTVRTAIVCSFVVGVTSNILIFGFIMYVMPAAATTNIGGYPLVAAMLNAPISMAI